MKKLFLISLLSFSAIAHDDCRQLNLAEQLMTFLPAKECPTNDEMLLKRAENEYKQNYGSLPVVKKTVKGFKLFGSQKEIDIANLMLGKKPPSTWNAAATGCDTVVCAFTKLYEGSKESALHLFNISAKTNYHLSLDQTINQGLAEQIWSPAEVRDVAAAIAKLPPELSRLEVKGIDRLADTLRLHDHGPNVGAFASPKIWMNEADLVVYDTGMKRTSQGDPMKSSSWPQEVIVHELCHHHDYKGFYGKTKTMTSEQKGSEFGALSGWKEITNNKGETEWVKTDDDFVSWYSETSPAEDYAESCMNYLLHPDALKEKAPEKYAYMKKNVFNNKEFLEKPWTNGLALEWPALAQKVNDESTCAAKIAECFGKAKFYSFSSLEAQLSSNQCFSKYKSDLLTFINTELGDDPKYCELGGSNAISKAGERICSGVVKNTVRGVESLKKVDFSSAISFCENKKDFSESCIIEAAGPDINISPELIPLVPRMLGNKIPDRMAALGNNSADLPSAGWITACMKQAKSVDVFMGTSGGKKSLYASYQDSKGKNTFLGKHIYQDYNHDDLNKSCAEAAVSSFATAGVKVPQSGYPTNVMQKPFVEELDSFHAEVLAEIKSSHKSNYILELLQRWEVKNPTKRAGIATDEFAKELRQKVKN